PTVRDAGIHSDTSRVLRSMPRQAGSSPQMSDLWAPDLSVPACVIRPKHGCAGGPCRCRPIWFWPVSIVEQYWAGVLQRLRPEIDVFAKLVQHMGERGRLNELALSRLLESFVADRIGVGTGILFDSHDRQGPQTDVVLFDRANQPAVMAQSTQVLFPV